jgi:uncharacterized repeat protein (TIGR03803 family)
LYPTNGTVFKLTAEGEVRVIASFDSSGPTGYSPSGLVPTADGGFFGLSNGQDVNGTIFRLTPAGVVTTVFSFDVTNGRSPNILLRGSDGNLYGTTTAGGSAGFGSVFKFTPAGELTTLFSFSRTNGVNPTSLVRGTDGTLYGTTSDWIGVNAPDTVFKLSPSGEFTVLLSSFNNAEVSRPFSLVLGIDGYLYGVDVNGGSNHFGSIFKVTPAGTLTTLLEFNGTNGWCPQRLVPGVDGNLYGTTEYGGPDFVGWIVSEDDMQPSGSGTIFKLTLNGDVSSLASSFQRVGGLPVNSLLQGRDGNIYFATESDMPPDPAGIFRLAPRPIISRQQRSGGQDVLTWTSFAGGVYQVESKATWSDQAWVPVLPTIVAVTNITSNTNAPAALAERYYRIRLLP